MEKQHVRNLARHHRPDLIPRYEQLYSRSAYLPSQERKRLTNLVHRNTANTALVTYGWTYDNEGNVKTFTNPDGTVTFGYDAAQQVTSASGGYLVGFVIAAAVTGFLAEHRWDRRFSSSISLMLTGNVIIYAVGLPWLAVVLNTNLEKTLEYGLYYFVPGDIIKLYLAAVLLPTAWKVTRRPDA